MKTNGYRWIGLRQNEDSCSKVLECSDPLLIVMPKTRLADEKITVPSHDGGCASDLGDKMFINSLDLGLARILPYAWFFRQNYIVKIKVFTRGNDSAQQRSQHVKR